MPIVAPKKSPPSRARAAEQLFRRALDDHLEPGGEPCRSITAPRIASRRRRPPRRRRALCSNGDRSNPAADVQALNKLLDKFASADSASRARHRHLDRRPALYCLINDAKALSQFQQLVELLQPGVRIDGEAQTYARETDRQVLGEP
jgi:hypothetical protein